MAFNVQDAVAKAAAAAPDMRESVGGGDFERELPAEGLTRLRFISYIELGQHTTKYKGEDKSKLKVALQFELSGPKHPLIKMGEVEVPHIITITENISLNEKANFYRLFKRMNYTGEYTLFAQMLGNEFLADIHHNTVGEGENKKTYANLRDDSGYTIRPPFVTDPETGDSRRLTVDAARTPLKCFLWDFSDKEMWDSLFIDGRYDDKKDDKGVVIKEGVSKNYWQNRIRAADNFKTSPLAELIFAGGIPDLPDSEQPARSDADVDAAADAKAGADADPLAGV